MKLLVGTHYFDTRKGGVEIVAGQLSRALASRMHVDLTWMASDASPPPEEFPGRIVCLPCWNGIERRIGVPLPIPSPHAIRIVSKAVAASDAVLLHDALYPTNLLAARFARRESKPVLVVQHVGSVPYRNRLLRGAMSIGNRLIAANVLHRADQVVFISGLTERFFRNLASFKRPPVVIFNGLRNDFLVEQEPMSRADARCRLDLPPDRFVALFVGRFVEKKGLIVLRGLVNALPDVQWIMCGWGPIDPSRWNAANVRVIGAATGSTLREVYRAADLLVLPSVGEGLPLVVQEALSFGTDVLASDELIVADPWLRGKITTGPVDHAAVDSTVAIWKGLIERHRRTPQTMSDLAELTREHYSWDASARRYSEILTDVVQAPV